MTSSSISAAAGRVFPVIAIILISFSHVYPRAEKNEFLREAAGITSQDIESASAKDELSLFDLYALAIESTERMAIEEEYKKQAEARQDRAKGAWFPRISVKGSAGSRETALGDRDWAYSVDLYARQNIISGLDEIAGIRGSSAGVRQQDLLLRQATRDYLYDIAVSYFQVISIEESLKNRRNILKHYRSLSSELQRRVNLGQTRRSELLRTNSRVSRLEAEVLALENRLSSARLSLSALSGIDKDVALVYPGQISETEDIMKENIRSYLTGRYDVLAAKEQISINEAELLAARGRRLPDIFVEGSYPLYEKSPGTQGYYAGIGAEFPIFSGGMVSARIREAESALRQSELRLSQVRRHAAVEIEEAFQAYRKGAAASVSFKKALDATEESYRLIQNDYRLNLVSLLDLINALTLLEEARDDYGNSLLDKRLARIRLGIASGEFTGRGIEILRD